ncbi:MAG TPA: sulfotransferase [Stellaceae bacterium]|nr:sulfotransferase [Stellaceae bacterium]
MAIPSFKSDPLSLSPPLPRQPPQDPAADPAGGGGATTAATLADAQRHWSAGETERAEQICRQLLAEAPQRERALHLLGLMAEARGDWSLALDYLEQACAPAGAATAILGDLAELYRRSGRLAEAEAAAKRAVAAARDSAVAWHRLALILIEAGDLEQARYCLQRAVERAPESVDARNNLGIVLQRLGELEPAREVYQSALALDPGSAAAHANMASLLGELGQFEAALDHARRAVAGAPGLLGPYVFAALAEANLGRNEAALDWLDRALALAPQSVPVLIARADVLRKLDRLEEGLGACRAALALEPENGEARNGLGLLCHALGRDEEALDAFDRACRLLPQPGIALANKAMVLLELGRRGEGLAFLDRALASDPELAAAWYTRADAKTFAADDPDIAAMERLLRSHPEHRRRPEQERILLHYALGKAYLDAKDAPRAFAHLNQGSRLKRAGLAYDAEAVSREMTAIADAFPATLFQRFADAGASSEMPVFVIGMPRSGTTLVEQILASHPLVHGGGEPRHVERLIRELGGAYPTTVATLPPERIAALGRRYLALTAPAPGALRFTDKMPNNFLHAGLIHLMLPGARIIHCRRDSVDTCLSCYSKLFTTGQEFSYDMAELGRYYRSYLALMAHWRSVLPAERFIEVDYERVVEDLEGEARRLIEFCGLAWDDACLRFHETARAVRSASMNQVRQPLYRSSVGRWQAFREELGPLLAALDGG